MSRSPSSTRHQLLGILVVVTSIAFTLAACRFYWSSLPPKLEVSQSYLALGQVLQGANKQSSVKLYNGNSQAVRIIELDPSCGCTSVSATSVLILSGKSVRIDLTISPGTRIGGFNAFVLIKWKLVSDASIQTTRIDLSYDSVRLIRTEPEICTFNYVDADRPDFVQFEVDRGTASLSWKDLSISDPRLNISYLPLGQSRFLVKVFFPLDKYPIGVLKDQILVNLISNNAVVGTAIIPFEVRLVSEISVKPVSLYLGVLSRQTPSRGNFTLNSLTSEIRFVSMISSCPNFLRVRVVGATPHQILFSYDTVPDSGKGNRSGTLLITIDGNRRREVLLPFVAYLK